MTTFKRGDIVLYRPILTMNLFGAVVASKSSMEIDGDLRCDIRGLSADYFKMYGLPHKLSLVISVLVERLELAPTVFSNGNEHTPDGWHLRGNVFESEFNGAICWHDNKDSSQAGWRYSFRDANGWVYGRRAESYEAARAAVEELCK
jgi:hypothetical protein